MLQTKGLTKKFDGFVAVDGIDFQVEEGSIKSVIGPNGAGKTTFFNMLSGAFPPSSGTIYLDGNDISGQPPYKIARRGLARSFQIINLFSELTVLENLRLGIQAWKEKELSPKYVLSRVESREDLRGPAIEVAKQVHLDEALDKKVNELSHGGKRKLEVGMTVSSNANLLLFDEPAAGLTTDETEELAEIIRDLSEGRTILLIEHDMEFVRNLSDEIAVLHQGQILAEGTPAEIQQNEDVKRVYLGDKDDNA